MRMDKNRKRISNKEYRKYFLKDPQIRNVAHTLALDMRKYEIELYWKRATYFWTFIAASLAGFGAIQALSIENKADLSIFISCLGMVFSVGWFCVNRGSKYWQENWENHIELLEDEECGPLYKTVLSRPAPESTMDYLQHWLNGPSAISVSKVNQIISLYVSILWAGLIYYSLPPFSFESEINWLYVTVIGLTIITCILFVTPFGKTYQDNHAPIATKRKIKVIQKSSQD